MKKTMTFAILAVFFQLSFPSKAMTGLQAADGFGTDVSGDFTGCYFSVTGRVNFIYSETNGNILVGGKFKGTRTDPDSYTGSTLYNIVMITGDNDMLCDKDFSFLSDSMVNCIMPWGSSNMLVGGLFEIADSGITNICRTCYDDDGYWSLDTNFTPNANGEVYAMAVLPDGKILVGGAFTRISGQARQYLVRLNGNGSLDTSFTALPDGLVMAIAVKPDGRVMIGGDFTAISGVARTRIALLSANGAVDPAFEASADGLVRALAVLPDQRCVAGGDFTSLSGVATRGLGILYRNGSAMADFQGRLNGSAHSIAIQPDGKIIAGGNFTLVGGAHARGKLVRLLNDGSPDLDFVAGTASTGIVKCVAVQPNGGIVVGGDFTEFNGKPVKYIARMYPNGLLDQTLDSAVSSFGSLGLRGLALQPNGGILFGGDVAAVDGTGASYLARLEADGELDTSFPADHPDDWVWNICIEKSSMGGILCGGDFGAFGMFTRKRIAHLYSDGILSSLCANGVNGSLGAIYAVASQTNRRVMVGGSFTNIAGVARRRIARLGSDGVVDTSFNAVADSTVYSIALQPDGRIVVGGSFQNLNGVSRKGLGRLYPDGVVDASFDPAPDNAVYSLRVQPDGKLLVGGMFTNIAGMVCPRFARLNADGSLDHVFEAPQLSGGAVYSIALRADGDVIAVGAFTNVSGSQCLRFAQFESDGALRESYSRYARISNTVCGAAIQPDGKVVLAGQFLQVSGLKRTFTRHYIARLSPYLSGAAQIIDASDDGSEVTWTLTGSSPQFARVEMECSTDGVTWTNLGHCAWSNGAWRLANASLPLYQVCYVRAVGVQPCGCFNASESVLETTRQFYLTPRVVPSIVITTPPGPSVLLPAGTTTYTVGGTQSNVLGDMNWTLNGGAPHYFAAANPWSFAATGLAAGTNRIVVAGTSISGTPIEKSVALVVLPEAPAGVEASDRLFHDRISVTWLPVDGAVYYEAWRGTLNSTAAATLIGGTAGTRFDDLSAAPGRYYFYWVKARHAEGTSAFSEGCAGRRGGLAVSYAGDIRGGLALFDEASGAWYIRSVAGDSIAWAVPWGFAGCVPVPGDYDGDGALDLAVFDAAAGNWYIQTLAAGNIIAWALPWGWAGATPVPGDYDGDGVSDLCVFDGASGAWYIMAVNGTVIAWATPWGWLGATPVAGDYDGDGAWDLCVFDSAGGTWFVTSLTRGLLGWAIAWGGPGGEPTPGDYNGDGAWDLAVYYEAAARWYAMTLAGEIVLWDAEWGGAGMTAVSGDFDGDGVWDLAVYDEANGRWYVRSVGGVGILWDSPWGGPGMRPVSY